jgi:molecular chaperone HtpG
VVDSEDLPLNISRELLQNNPQVTQIRTGVTGRVISEIDTLAAKTPDDFNKIWDAFGPILKEGIYQDRERRDQLLALARFTTTVDGGPRTLRQYLADLRPNQTEIYYLVGDSLERIKSNPKLEAARARGIEVLLLTDPVDAFWTSLPLGYEGKPLKSLSHGEVNFGLVPVIDTRVGSEPEELSTPQEGPSVIDAVKAVLGERVSEVRASQRLTDSAVCLVAAGLGPDRELERLLARQNPGVRAKPILELNLRHALVKALSAANTDGRQEDVADMAALLFEQAQILDGEVPDDPAAFANRLNRLIVRGIVGSPR